jgi:hypothetical protein
MSQRTIGHGGLGALQFRCESTNFYGKNLVHPILPQISTNLWGFFQTRVGRLASPDSFMQVLLVAVQVGQILDVILFNSVSSFRSRLWKARFILQRALAWAPTQPENTWQQKNVWDHFTYGLQCVVPNERLKVARQSDT